MLSDLFMTKYTFAMFFIVKCVTCVRKLCFEYKGWPLGKHVKISLLVSLRSL